MRLRAKSFIAPVLSLCLTWPAAGQTDCPEEELPPPTTEEPRELPRELPDRHQPRDRDDDRPHGHQPPPTHPLGPDLDATDYPRVYGGGLHTTMGTDLGDQIGHLGGLVYQASNCEEGRLYFTGGPETTCEYIVMAGELTVAITSATRGGYAVPGAEDFLGELSRAFRGLPGPGGRYARIATRIGGEITQAGARFAERNGNMLVDITVTIPRQRITVTCAPAQLCIDGQLVDAGLAEKNRTTTEMRPYTRSASSVLLEERHRAVTRLVNGARFDPPGDDPCACEQDSGSTGGDGGSSAGGEPGIATGGNEGSGRDCSEIRRRLDASRAALETAREVLELFKADKLILERHYRAVADEHERALDEATAEYNQTVEEHVNATAEVERYLEAVRSSRDDATRDRASAGYRRATARQSAAQTAMSAARQRMIDLSRPPAELGRITDEIGVILGKIVDMLEQILEYSNAIEQLEAELAECESGR